MFRCAYGMCVLMMGVAAALAGCADRAGGASEKATPAGSPRKDVGKAEDPGVRFEKAMFGAGCFWGVESTFRKVPGVKDVAVGYSGGAKENPTYEEVCTDTTGHAEVVEVTYDPAKVSYAKLLEVFFENHDPTTLNRQGPDAGRQYRSAVFYTTPEQQKLASAEKARRTESGEYVGPIVTEISPAKTFYRAEEYHQQYFAKKGVNWSCHTGNGKKKGVLGF